MRARAPRLARAFRAAAALLALAALAGGCAGGRPRIERDFLDTIKHAERVTVSRCEFPDPTETEGEAVAKSPDDPFPDLVRVASATPDARWTARAAGKLIGSLEYAPDPYAPCRSCPLEAVFELRFERAGRVARAFVFPARHEVRLYSATFPQVWRPRPDRVPHLLALVREALAADPLTISMDAKGHLDADGFRRAHPSMNFFEVLPELLVAPDSIAPHYPESARAAGIEGMVLLSVHVTAEGAVDSARVVRSIPELDAAAIESAYRMRFRPARSFGEPAATWIAVPVSFKLR